MQRVVLLLNCETQQGDRVVVAGNHEVLGQWEPSMSKLELRRTRGRAGPWHGDALLPAGLHVRFKFVIVGASGELRWELSLPDRELFVPSSGDVEFHAAGFDSPGVGLHLDFSTPDDLPDTRAGRQDPGKHMVRRVVRLLSEAVVYDAGPSVVGDVHQKSYEAAIEVLRQVATTTTKAMLCRRAPSKDQPWPRASDDINEQATTCNTLKDLGLSSSSELPPLVPQEDRATDGGSTSRSADSLVVFLEQEMSSLEAQRAVLEA